MKYNVLYTTTASATVTVDAEDADEARDKADEAFDGPSICAQCSGWGRTGATSGIDLGDWEPDESPDGVWEA